jgi:hypothetical protein
MVILSQECTICCESMRARLRTRRAMGANGTKSWTFRLSDYEIGRGTRNTQGTWSCDDVDGAESLLTSEPYIASAWRIAECAGCNTEYLPEPGLAAMHVPCDRGAWNTRFTSRHAARSDGIWVSCQESSRRRRKDETSRGEKPAAVAVPRGELLLRGHRMGSLRASPGGGGGKAQHATGMSCLVAVSGLALHTCAHSPDAGIRLQV